MCQIRGMKINKRYNVSLYREIALLEKNFCNQNKASGIELMFCYNQTRFLCIERMMNFMFVTKQRFFF